MDLKYIVIQAGGKGSRLGYLTANKPKALISVNGKPIIFHLMSLFPKANYLIISDYKNEILKKYLSIFCKYKFKIIKAKGEGTCSGIEEAIKNIPDNTNFLISWCDLYYKGIFYPQNMDGKDNYIGLSDNFRCRWSFRKGHLIKSATKKNGIAGVYLFQNKNEIKSVPNNGEFCEFLEEMGVKFLPFCLKNTSEIGDLKTYLKISRGFINTRPFNCIEFKDKLIIKKPVDKQGLHLANLEKNWYKNTAKLKLEFIPKIFNFNPLEMQRINGLPLYKYKTTKIGKKNILGQIINDLSLLHSSLPVQIGNYFANNDEALIGKTKKRLDLIANLIPNIEKDFFYINKLKCMNFYKNWEQIEKLVEKYFTNKYTLIHGDPTFSNIMVEPGNDKLFFIDPRGYFGKMKLFGDEDYDWAKLYYSLVGNYDQLNDKNFALRIDGDKVDLNIKSSGWESMEKDFFIKIKRDQNKIRIYHAIIWLSLTSYAWDNYDMICAAFYNGIRLLQELYNAEAS